jgi:hypothetical protein
MKLIIQNIIPFCVMGFFFFFFFPLASEYEIASRSSSYKLGRVCVIVITW